MVEELVKTIEDQKGLQLVRQAIEADNMSTAEAFFHVGPMKTLQPVELDLLRRLKAYTQDETLIDLYFCAKYLQLTAHRSGMFALKVAACVGPEGGRRQTIVTGGKNGKIKLWTLKRGKKPGIEGLRAAGQLGPRRGVSQA